MNKILEIFTSGDAVFNVILPAYLILAAANSGSFIEHDFIINDYNCIVDVYYL